ncbi:MAG: hypothetical protein ABSB89_07665 [Candidatus Bathyarchaeia archaeon]
MLELFTILDVWFEGRRLAKIRLRAKQLTCLFLMFTSVLLGFSFLPRAKAQMEVFSVTPTTGNVGTNVTVVANLTTVNGAYNVAFNGAVLAVGTAVGNSVTASFFVPEAAAGNYTVTVNDVSANESATFENFTVLTAYFLNVTVPPAPAQFQEGNSVPISFNVTGDGADVAEDAQIEVVNPDGLSYQESVGLVTSALGSGVVTVPYPGNFTSGANTNFVGIYTVSTVANGTLVSPIGFPVGLTNSTEYHRLQTVYIVATGYNVNENVTLNVTGTNVQYSVNLTATPAGLINFSGFVVPTNATVDNYTVSIVSTEIALPTAKVPPDTQVFEVPGFAFNVTTVNLAGEAVPGVVVEAFENGTSVSNQTADSNGLTVSMLEIGNFTLEGFYQAVEVGEGNFTVNNTETGNLVLNLTDLGVKVVAFVNGNEVGIPEAGVNLTPVDVTLFTDVNGNAEEQSLLPNSTYDLTAGRYDTLFNATNVIESSSNSTLSNGTILNLFVGESPVAVYNVTIACPSFALQIVALEASGQPFSNATVEASELAGGINYEGSTDSSGAVVFQNATFGEYYVEVFDSAGTEINSTTLELFQDQNVTVNCYLYGLSISVTVTDYFGQPFGNTEVTLQGNGVQPVSSRTQANGTVTFANLVGQSYNVSVYLSNNGSPNYVANLFVDGSTAVSIKMNRYVLLAGDPVETTQLVVVIIIVLTVLLVLVFEVFRRMRGRGKKQTVESK